MLGNQRDVLTKRTRVPVWLCVGAAVCLAVLAGAFYWSQSRSPADSVKQIEKAFSEHDYASFQKYVDVDSVVNRLIYDVVVIGRAESQKQGVEVDFSTGLAQLNKPQYVLEAKQ